MPNWCSNTLTITGPEKDCVAFKEAAVGVAPTYEPDSDWSEGNTEEKSESILNFHSLVPIPEESLKAGYNGKNNPDVPSGYTAEANCWGVKWGACDPYLIESAGELEYTFDSAWAPPIEWISQVAEQYPSLRFKVFYFEPGMQFKGEAIFEAGACVEDDTQEFTRQDWIDICGMSEEEE